MAEDALELEPRHNDLLYSRQGVGQLYSVSQIWSICSFYEWTFIGMQAFPFTYILSTIAFWVSQKLEILTVATEKID